MHPIIHRLSYASDQTARFSRLSIVAVIVAVFSWPPLLESLVRLVYEHVLPLGQADRFLEADGWIIILIPMIWATILPVVAILHILASGGRLKGIVLCIIAISIVALGWLIVFVDKEVARC